MSQSQLLEQIHDLVRQYFEEEPPSEFIPGETSVPLMKPSYGWQEVNQAVESLLTTQITLNQTRGNKVYQFEQLWSQYIGTQFGVMVNSGSSANLLALFVLANPSTANCIEPGDEVITPAVTWHTTISPIICVGAKPVLVDVSLSDFTIDVNAIESVITSRTKAIMPVHLLGNPCGMEDILDLAARHDLYVIEDVCEAHGAQVGERRCGSMGHIGTFSFFFSHHITTMEGGMLMTNDLQIAELAQIMRSQGVIRNTERPDELAAYYRNKPEYAEIDERYLFANLGFNLRPTELNGGFGIEQIKKIDGFLRQRVENGQYWIKRLRHYEDLFYLPGDSEGGHAWFCFPLIIRRSAPFSRDEIVGFLRNRRIETRPIMAGNVARQPVMALFPHRKTALPNADLIHTNGFFWGNHQGILRAECEYVADCIDEFVAGKRG